MNRQALPLLLLLALPYSTATLAHAQATRTWVSGVGDDVNPCSRTAPCKTFAGAFLNTAAGGEISVLDPGGFASITIDKSFTLNGDGVLAGITSNSTVQNAITINAPGGHVTIRNLSLQGSAFGTNPAVTGILVLAAAEVNIENVTIVGFQSYGVRVSSPSIVTLKNVSIDSAGINGVFADVPSGLANISLQNVDVQHSGTAVRGNASGSGKVNLGISDSVLNQNSIAGVVATGATNVLLDRSSINQNNIAVQTGTGATIRLSNNNVFDNQTGFSCTGGALLSNGDNRKGGNVGGALPVCSPSGTIALQ